MGMMMGMIIILRVKKVLLVQSMKRKGQKLKEMKKMKMNIMKTQIVIMKVLMMNKYDNICFNMIYFIICVIVCDDNIFFPNLFFFVFSLCLSLFFFCISSKQRVIFFIFQYIVCFIFSCFFFVQ